MMRWLLPILAFMLMLQTAHARAQARGLHLDVFGSFTTKDRLVVTQVARKVYTNLQPNQISATSVMLVGQYNMFQGGRYTLYSGGGLGAVHLGYDDRLAGYSNAQIIVGGELTIGLRFQVANHQSLFVEGQYTRSKDVRVVNHPPTRDAAYHNRAVVFGVRHSF